MAFGKRLAFATVCSAIIVAPIAFAAKGMSGMFDLSAISAAPGGKAKGETGTANALLAGTADNRADLKLNTVSGGDFAVQLAEDQNGESIVSDTVIAETPLGEEMSDIPAGESGGPPGGGGGGGGAGGGGAGGGGGALGGLLGIAGLAAGIVAASSSDDDAPIAASPS